MIDRKTLQKALALISALERLEGSDRQVRVVGIWTLLDRTAPMPDYRLVWPLSGKERLN